MLRLVRGSCTKKAVVKIGSEKNFRIPYLTFPVHLLSIIRVSYLNLRILYNLL